MEGEEPLGGANVSLGFLLGESKEEGDLEPDSLPLSLPFEEGVAEPAKLMRKERDPETLPLPLPLRDGVAEPLATALGGVSDPLPIAESVTEPEGLRLLLPLEVGVTESEELVLRE